MKISTFVANLITDDMAATVAFYTEQLDFKLTMSVPEQAPFNWVLLKHDTVELMFQTRGDFSDDLKINLEEATGGTLLFHAHVVNIAGWFERLQSTVKLAFPIRHTFYGMDEFGFYDPSGYLIVLAEAKGETV
ncbi:MAG: VOC family protein [Bacteroidota bacterium]